MENRGMVVDTSVFIDFLRANKKEETLLFNMPDNSKLYVSTVTLFELYAGATTPAKWEDIRLLTEDLVLLPLTIDIAKHAARIFQKLRIENQIIEFRDIFIGATALANNLPILTLNKKHFSRIANLEII